MRTLRSVMLELEAGLRDGSVVLRKDDAVDFRPLTPGQRRQLGLPNPPAAVEVIDLTKQTLVLHGTTCHADGRRTEHEVVIGPPGREWPLLTLAVIVRLVLLAALLGGAAAAAVWVVPAR